MVATETSIVERKKERKKELWQNAKVSLHLVASHECSLSLRAMLNET